MSIKPSAAAEIRGLIESLASGDDIKREGAIARLAVIGSRAVDRLLATYAAPETTRATRVAILRVLEAIGDARAIPVAREGLREGSDVAIAAAGALRALLDSPAADASSESLDTLVATALDRKLERRVRMAAQAALQDMPAAVRDRVNAALDEGETPAGGPADAGWQDAIDGRLPDDPAALRESVQARAPAAPLSVLQKLVDAVRAREADTAPASRAAEWTALRGAIHQVLALRGSRVAIYDLRETIAAAAGPLPATFLTALHLVGDESCLPPIAAAHKRAGGEERWRHQLEEAFRAIVKREKLSRKPVSKLLGKSAKG